MATAQSAPKLDIVEFAEDQQILELEKAEKQRPGIFEHPIRIPIVLDYYLKEMKTCAELATEQSRPSEIMAFGGSNSAFDVCGEMTEKSSDDGAVMKKKKLKVRKENVGLRLNNNMISSVHDLPQVLRGIPNSPIPKPEKYLLWLDLSFNQLANVDPALLQFKNLKILYLHGNKLTSLSQVEKLANLPNLLSLTTNGNAALEKVKYYRRFVVGALPQVHSLDHTLVTKDERRAAVAFYEIYVVKRDAARQRARDKREAADAAF